MIVVKPETVTESVIISTNVPETDAPVWNNTTNYVIGNTVIYDHKIYEALNNNHNKIPSSNPLDWLFVNSTNRYRVFDNVIGNLTTNPNSIQYTLKLDKIVTSISFFNLVASSVQIQVTDPVDGLVYNKTFNLVDLEDITGYYAYFFAEVDEPKVNLTVLDLPTYPLANIAIVINNIGSTASCGEIVLGAQKKLGITNYGTSIGLRDYSKKETDEFGFTTIVERRFAKTAEYDCTFNNSDLSSVQRFLASVRAVPIVWIGESSMDETIVYGYYKNFRIAINGVTHADGTIEVEGLT